MLRMRFPSGPAAGLTVLLLVSAAPASSALASPALGAEPIPGQLLVKVAPGADALLLERVDALGDDVRARRSLPAPRRLDRVGLARWYTVEVPLGSEAALVESFAVEPWVEHASRNARAGGVTGDPQVFPNDPFLGNQWHLHQGNDIDMDVPEAWALRGGFEADGDLLVGIVDTGFEPFGGSAEFAGDTYTNPIEVVNGLDDDGNGFVDDVSGWDFANDDNVPNDDFGHGVPVMGIIGAAADNAFETAGIAHGVTFLHVKIFNDEGNFPETGPYAGFVAGAAGLEYVVDQGVDLINNSWKSGDEAVPIINDAVQYALDNGVHNVFGAANDNSPTGWPAMVPGVIAVAAIDAFGAKADFSNYGPWVHLSAAGVNVASNYVFGIGPVLVSGTSFSAPCVSGCALLLLSEDRDLSTDDVRDILMESAVDVDALNPGWEGLLGTGHVNAHQALRRLEHVADLGQATAGTFAPRLNAWGLPLAGETLTWSVSGGAPSELGVMFHGTAAVDVPLLGGVLVPNPTVVVPVTLDAGGAHRATHVLGGSLPSGPVLWSQYLGIDLGAPESISFSNAIVFSGA